MVATAFKREYKRRICKALGLDPQGVRTLSIHMDPNDAIIVDIGKYVFDNEMETIILETREFELVPRSDEVKKEIVQK